MTTTNMLQKENMNDLLHELHDDSNIFAESPRDVTKVVKEEDITVGPIIGSGAFSDVKVGKCDCLFNYRNHSVDGLLQLRQSVIISNGSSNRKGKVEEANESEYSASSARSKGNSYAVKVLRDDLTRSMNQLGAVNLAVEAEFLRTISHANIVTLYGVGESPGNSNFFIILEMLNSTLNEEMIQWSEHEKSIKNFSPNRKTKKVELEHLLNQRIDVACQVSAGLKYLHEHNILFRDLKPENIGLDVNRCVKIFDFGMAKELKEKASVGIDRFNATCKTGTPRYMAPEVFFGEPYGLPADVYSFSLVLWEIMALEKIFSDNDGEENHVVNVYMKKLRPKISRSWPKQIQVLIRDGWSHQSSTRPKIQVIHKSLKDLL